MIKYANQVLYDQYKADKLQDVQDGLQKIGDKIFVHESNQHS